MYDHENPTYWRALGVCRELMKDWLGAATALTLAAAHMDRPDHSLELSLAECLMAADELDAAERRLAELLNAPQDNSGGEDWRDRAKSLQSRLSAASAGRMRGLRAHKPE